MPSKSFFEFKFGLLMSNLLEIFSKITKQTMPSKKPMQGGTNDHLFKWEDRSSAGKINDQMADAIITPAEKPSIIFFVFVPISFLTKNTIKTPSTVPTKGSDIPKISFQFICIPTKCDIFIVCKMFNKCQNEIKKEGITSFLHIFFEKAQLCYTK